MDRRHFVTVVGAGTVTALSGCLGYELTSSEQIETKDDEIANLEAEISDLEDDIEQYEEEIAALEADVEQRDNEIASLETDLDDLRADRKSLVEAQLADLYEAGHGFYELAQTEFQRGTSAFENREFSRAAGNFSSAFGHYDAAVNLTYHVVTLAEEETYTNAVDLATESNLYAQNMKESAERYSVGAQYYATDRSSQGETEADDGQSAFESAQEYRFAALSEFTDTV